MRPKRPFNPKEFLASGKTWHDRIAPLAFPILLECAIQRRYITYSGLAEEINLRFDEQIKPRKTLYGHPIGKIGFALEELALQWQDEIPPLSALVIDKNTRRPGKGAFEFIRRYLSNSNEKFSLDTIDTDFLLNLVCDYSWHQVAKYFDVPLTATEDMKLSERPIQLPKIISRFSSYEESPDHKKLKKIVAESPNLFKDFGIFQNGVNEHVIRSGDRLDVFFWSQATCLAVEVKAANAPESEVFRGIFQCVKYKAVLQATQFSQGSIPNAQAALVLQRSLPFEAERLAERLKVRVIRVQD